ncbi:MAG: hypothetical protein HYV07_28230 [Deltaproteobacteria bacterium]|nr:hypothetical protein [Deltaproteobacteria bacterium]
MRAPRSSSVALSLACAAGVACAEDPAPGPPPCGSGPVALRTLIPGPLDPGFDDSLADRAAAYDRVHFALSSYATGMSADLSLATTASVAERDLVQGFVERGTGYTFEAFAGKRPEELFVFNKSTGLYSGAGIVADAYRYGALRDAGAACDDVDHARRALATAIDGLIVAARIDGVPGVTARSVLRLDFPHPDVTTTPLFDASGSPLPPEKNNGEWRDDQTGSYSNWVWEDSISRDMILGWAFAYGALWEVIAADPTFDEAKKAALRADAADMARALMKVRESGYDLEIPDADGRLTFHAYLNENVVDRILAPGVRNGFHATMAIGIVASLAYASGDAEIAAYLTQELLGRRELAKMASDDMVVVNLGVGSNFSTFNMAFTAMLMAQRFVDVDPANAFLEDALLHELYTKPEASDERQPKDMHQSLFDLTYAAGKSGAKAGRAGTDPDATARDSALQTLREYAPAPVWDERVINCDEAEISSGSCVLLDGTSAHVLGEVARNGGLVTKEPIPMRVRPRSNYHWRSDPYRPNGDGGGRNLYPAVDWRFAYWLGRWVRE